MQKIKIEIDPEEVLNEVGAKEAVKFFGLKPGVLEYVTDDDYLECCDIDHLMKKIDEVFPGRMEAFIEEIHND